MRRQGGFTFVELLVSLALLSLLAVSVFGTFLVGHRSVKVMTRGLDINQQLRSAIKMMADDLSYATWFTGKDDRSSLGCYTTDDPGNVLNGCDFSVYVEQPKANNNDSFWKSFPDWPGDLTQNDPLRIRYSLVEGNLLREVYRVGSLDRVYSSRILVSDLKPYTEREGETGSSLVQLADGLIRVTLSTNAPVGGGRVVQVATVFYMR